jgi:leucyl-tRNA synthetase
LQVLNDAYKQESLSTEAAEQFVQMLSPLAPHIAEELWQLLGHEGSISYVTWPTYDEAYTVDAEVEIVVQVNGKIVQRVMIPQDMGQEEMQTFALALPNVNAAVEGKTVRKIIAVPGKLVNIVVG